MAAPMTSERLDSIEAHNADGMMDYRDIDDLVAEVRRLRNHVGELRDYLGRANAVADRLDELEAGIREHRAGHPSARDEEWGYVHDRDALVTARR